MGLSRRKYRAHLVLLALPTVVLHERGGKPQHDLSLYAIMFEEEFQECILDVVSPESKWFTKKTVCKYT